MWCLFSVAFVELVVLGLVVVVVGTVSFRAGGRLRFDNCSGICSVAVNILARAGATAAVP